MNEGAIEVPGKSAELGFTFGDALIAVKRGRKIARAGWNGKGMWVWLCEADGEEWYARDGGLYMRRSYLYMKAADDTVVPWVASQTDLLAEDWCVVE